MCKYRSIGHALASDFVMFAASASTRMDSTMMGKGHPLKAGAPTVVEAAEARLHYCGCGCCKHSKNMCKCQSNMGIFGYLYDFLVKYYVNAERMHLATFTAPEFVITPCA